MNSMNDFLPSRKVTAFILVPVITVFSLWVITRHYSQPTVIEDKKSGLEVALEEGERQFQEQDTDGDGLKDWEEFLYQTDERNPDTDGDGSSDGLEVARGFDPLVAGTGIDEEVVSENKSGITFYKNDPSLTRTDVLARDIFVAYAELKNGNSLDATGVRDRALENAIKDNADAESKILYTLEDVRVVADSGLAAQRYRESYSRATQSLSTIQFSEIDLFSRHIQNSDPDALIELGKNQRSYQAFLDELLLIPTPNTIKLIHVELLNNVSILVSTIENMALVETDPLLGLVYAQKFLEDEDLLRKNTEALLLYFTNNNL